MATNDSQKQFLTLIRGFASESSQGERRIVDLKKRIDELRYEIVGANAELEEAKCAKESIEQDIKGYEVELAMNEASIQTLEARVCLIQNEVAAAKSELEALKTSEFEALFASLGNELQNRCLCPSCHRDNAEASGVTLQTSSGS
ncbi:hypothetical protein ACET3Z_011350 [Daucus carota]